MLYNGQHEHAYLLAFRRVIISGNCAPIFTRTLTGTAADCFSLLQGGRARLQSAESERNIGSLARRRHRHLQRHVPVVELVCLRAKQPRLGVPQGTHRRHRPRGQVGHDGHLHERPGQLRRLEGRVSTVVTWQLLWCYCRNVTIVTMLLL